MLADAEGVLQRRFEEMELLPGFRRRRPRPPPAIRKAPVPAPIPETNPILPPAPAGPVVPAIEQAVAPIANLENMQLKDAAAIPPAEVPQLLPQAPIAQPVAPIPRPPPPPPPFHQPPQFPHNQPYDPDAPRIKIRDLSEPLPEILDDPVPPPRLEARRPPPIRQAFRQPTAKEKVAQHQAAVEAQREAQRVAGVGVQKNGAAAMVAAARLRRPAGKVLV
jgi:hypothetical protein